MKIRTTMVALTAAAAVVVGIAAASPATAAGAPSAHSAAGYLLGRLIDGTHYESTYTCTAADQSWGCGPVGSVQDYGPDYGLTIDAAFELLAAGGHASSVSALGFYLAAQATNYTSIGTASPNVGAIAKLALFAEAAGQNPKAFGGKDLISGIDGLICLDAVAPCAGSGAYKSAYASTLIQSLGVMAQLRAGDTSHAAAPIGYLESVQRTDGGWPSSLPATTSSMSENDSTSYAVMALNLVGNTASRAAVKKGLAWLAQQQDAAGGWSGVSADSTNSTGLAIQALSLSPVTYAKQIAKAEAFLAGQQNADGGFNIDPSTPGSDIRSTAQAAGGATGISFATLGHRLKSVVKVKTKTVNIHPRTRVKITITITSAGAVVDGAIVKATNLAGQKLASATVSGGKAVLTLPKLKKGKRTILVRYAGTSSAAASHTKIVFFSK